MTDRPVQFGIATPPSQVSYDDLARVWTEADGVPQIAHAWLYDHLVPIFGDPDGPTLESWTLLANLLGRTTQLRGGIMVTSNRFRPPALLARMAATVDVASTGRLEFGIGVGSLPGHPLAPREYVAHGLPYVDTDTAVGTFAEGMAAIRRLWTASEPFDLDGDYMKLQGAWCNPKPVQRPGPPVTIGGRATRTLRIVAQHADVWGFPGVDVATALERGAVLDRLCAEIGRDPREIGRSLIVPVSYDDPAAARDAAQAAIEAGFRHPLLSLPAPWPAGVARWVADEIIDPVAAA